MAKAPVKHIHKYMKTVLRHVFVWRCADCYHFMPHHLTHLIEGRESLCWGCGKIFRLDDDTMKDDMPTCIICRQSNAESFNLPESKVM